MTIEQWGILTAVVLLVWCAVYAAHCAYYNGVNDGYAVTQEPWNPGYSKARVYLTKYWGFCPETRDQEEDYDL